MEWDDARAAQRQILLGRPVAYYTDVAAHFEHQDWLPPHGRRPVRGDPGLGTERMRTAYNGGVEGSTISLPWGDGQTTTGTDLDANHYGTLDYDAESGTDHAQFRQYSSAQGRWLAPDPYSGSYTVWNPQSFNRYVYAGNNPLAAVDPSGMCEAYDGYGGVGCTWNLMVGLGGSGGGSYGGGGGGVSGIVTPDNGVPVQFIGYDANGDPVWENLANGETFGQSGADELGISDLWFDGNSTNSYFGINSVSGGSGGGGASAASNGLPPVVDKLIRYIMDKVMSKGSPASGIPWNIDKRIINCTDNLLRDITEKVKDVTNPQSSVDPLGNFQRCMQGLSDPLTNPF